MDERGFAAVVGHKDVIQHIKNASVYGRVSHAYLFSGEPGSGKKLTYQKCFCLRQSLTRVPLFGGARLREEAALIAFCDAPRMQEEFRKSLLCL